MNFKRGRQNYIKYNASYELSSELDHYHFYPHSLTKANNVAKPNISEVKKNTLLTLVEDALKSHDKRHGLIIYMVERRTTSISSTTKGLGGCTKVTLQRQKRRKRKRNYIKVKKIIPHFALSL